MDYTWAKKLGMIRRAVGSQFDEICNSTYPKWLRQIPSAGSLLTSSLPSRMIVERTCLV